MAEKITLETIRRSQILDAAVKTLSEHGSSNVTFDDIARATGLSKGGVVHYYRNKDELFKAGFGSFFERIIERGRATNFHALKGTTNHESPRLRSGLRGFASETGARAHIALGFGGETSRACKKAGVTWDPMDERDIAIQGTLDRKALCIPVPSSKPPHRRPARSLSSAGLS